MQVSLVLYAVTARNSYAICCYTTSKCVEIYAWPYTPDKLWRNVHYFRSHVERTYTTLVSVWKRKTRNAKTWFSNKVQHA